MGTHYNGTESEVTALDAFIKLQRASESVAAHLAARLSSEGLTLPQFGILETLLHLGALCQRDLGRKLLRTGGNITLVVDNLERRGLVRRVRGKNDRRFVTVHLTPAGRALIASAFPAHAQAIAASFSVLTIREQRQLAALCKKLGLSLGS